MAEFESAFRATIWREGGYANDLSDRGGETYCGISRKFWPKWDGWPLIDAVKAKNPLDIDQALSENRTVSHSVAMFYKANFWKYDGVTDQPIAEKLFDMAVNMGSEQAHRYIQRIVEVVLDGKFGPRTLAAINAVDPHRLLFELRVISATHYVDIMLRDSSQQKFKNGWLRRAIA